MSGLRVYAYASEGFDTAGLAGSPTYANRFYGYPDYSILTDSTGSFYYYASGFDAVTAVAAAGGVSTPTLRQPGAEADSRRARPRRQCIARRWSDTTAKGFHGLRCLLDPRRRRPAVLAGSAAGGNRFYGYANYGTLSDSAGSFYHFASGFAELAASAAGSGNAAYLYGSSGNDVLTARPARVEFDRAAG